MAHKTYIVHNGGAHLDEVVACALMLVGDAWNHCEASDGAWREALDEVAAATRIERRDPTDAELDDAAVAVIDVGGRYDPALCNFDHHQFPRGTAESAMSLVAASIAIPCGAFDGTAAYGPGSAEYPVDSLASFMERAYPWFRTRVAVDSCGPFATAKGAGVEWDTVAKFLGPCEGIVLKAFEDAAPEARAAVVKPLAEMILRRYGAWTDVASAVRYDHPWWSDGDFTIADFTDADPVEAEACSDMLTAQVHGVAVFHDNRGSGLTLLRLRDDPRIDFTKVKGDPEVVFAHAGGFIVKTKSKDIGKAWDLIETAYAEGGAK